MIEKTLSCFNKILLVWKLYQPVIILQQPYEDFNILDNCQTYLKAKNFSFLKRNFAHIMLKTPYIILFIAALFYQLPAQAQSINWLPMEKAQKLAAQNNKKVMIYAFASWCGYCKKVEAEVFPDEAVADSLHKYFYPVRIDIESNEKVTFNGQQFTEQVLSRRFRVYSTPTFIFLTPDGSVIGVQPGFMPADIFETMLGYVGDGYHQQMSFKQYLDKINS